ncbi:hypothetical protein [Paenibacillus methanolicus]|uniref:Uncharacterized protein n=1 Tax=Paenibacillus methanolicus TaxID=582686 RepID=A0A5S5CHK3_9BACL|nr:hypothetical protein [Paenibacillus methanolicus]TYP79266.1 hypothetical protein BCM02_101384 [Paenibacillus methanolicus]
MNAYTQATFQAVADAIVPWGKQPGRYPIAAFVRQQIDHSQFVPPDTDPSHPIEPLSLSTAKLLDVGAAALIERGLTIHPIRNGQFPGGGLFASLARIDRLRVIALLNQSAVPMDAMPSLYRDNPGLVLTMMDSLHQLTMFGYDSEWFGYGTTRLLPPNDQRVEYFPPSWCQTGYPGPAFGYRALRCGSLPPMRSGGDDHRE